LKLILYSTLISLQGNKLAYNLFPKEVKFVELQGQALAGAIVLCSWGRNFTLTMPLATTVGWDKLNTAQRIPSSGLASYPGGI